MTRILLLGAAILGAAVVAGASVHLSRPAPLAGTFDSPEALASAVLDAFQRQDRPALERLALSDREFADHVWPVLPAARPERNLSVEFVWGDLAAKSRAHLTRNLQRGLPPGARVTALAFEGETSRHGGVTIRRQSVLTVTGADGSLARVRLFGSLIEQDGRYKVFSYVTD
jgi:hypothetical protein